MEQSFKYEIVKVVEENDFFNTLRGGGTCSHIYNTEAIKEIINFTPKNIQYIYY